MLKEDTIQLQTDLAQYCRDGKLIELEGARTDRLHHYRRLVYNVMYGLMSKAYPIARSILSEEEFKALLNAFFVQHDAQTPEVWKVPGEFYNFISQSDHTLKEKYPYLTDLLNMEWMEIYVFNNLEKSVGKYAPVEPVESAVPVINPDYVVLELQFPVHKGDWEHITSKKGNYRLLVFRNNSTKKVHFMEISVLHKTMLDMLQEKSLFLNDAYLAVCDHYGVEMTAKFKEQLTAFVAKLYQDRMILGTAS